MNRLSMRMFTVINGKQTQALLPSRYFVATPFLTLKTLLLNQAETVNAPTKADTHTPMVLQTSCTHSHFVMLHLTIPPSAVCFYSPTHSMTELFISPLFEKKKKKGVRAVDSSVLLSSNLKMPVILHTEPFWRLALQCGEV